MMLKREILSALSSVGSATTTEELEQADAAYKKARCTARSVGYRSAHPSSGWPANSGGVGALGKAPFCEAPADTARQGYDIQRGRSLIVTTWPC